MRGRRPRRRPERASRRTGIFQHVRGATNPRGSVHRGGHSGGCDVGQAETAPVQQAVGPDPKAPTTPETTGNPQDAPALGPASPRVAESADLVPEAALTLFDRPTGAGRHQAGPGCWRRSTELPCQLARARCLNTRAPLTRRSPPMPGLILLADRAPRSPHPARARAAA